MCTRILWSSQGHSRTAQGGPAQGNVLVSRSMDWYQDTDTILAVRPRGEERLSMPSTPTLPGNFTWTSRFGSVVALMYREAAVDGVNEAGFQASGLYLSESDYGDRDPARPGLELFWAIQYLLDCFDNVADAVRSLTERDIQLIAKDLGSKPGTGHLALADQDGDSAIVEFRDGKAVVHEGKQYTVMANSPWYEEQLELKERYEGLGGDQPLPGGVDSPDRFARAAYYSAQLPSTADAREAAAYMFSVIRNASAPFGTADEVRPNISTTRWRTVADLTERRYFFESTTSPNVVWVELSQVDFSEGGPELHLDVASEHDHVGNVTGEFAPAG
ncbi:MULTISPECIES: linear amide C-N hydrolase [Streptomyces]|uniref:Linear amide C-N hydrolase n=1 Tax=Streptomyces doudnae TaxID=3075536 RepID=A0ABD5EZQ2_9ACTN|nr:MULTISPECIES: linear amide C-N hydrolase [unclassified Streptomyces]MDT0439484.1 linear amide C-N hydrolase [Streptomyces sp. DSM 41981]MYQ69282.1 linear amide C-N hydrolase [Streptomyces sp. SID4950]SCE52631.1 penicillin amidase Cysteine peptidase. MEROPS family C59 [Streptomyces sp. SolWspMP-5a-2]